MFYCYLLATRSGRVTYVGATTDPDRRLEQHNGKRAGGARATALQVARGEEWQRICVVSGIPEWRSALQIEWRWKQLGRSTMKSRGDSALHRRLRALHTLLAMEKPTQTAIPYDAYPDGPPQIQWDSEEARQLYLSLGSTARENAQTANDPPLSSLSIPAESDETESILLDPFSP
jgi:predicted GIY-YIG superfamily endonuclease